MITTQKWKWIDFLAQPPEETMNFDRTLLAQMKQEPTSPIIRFYKWPKKALSYGRTQGVPEPTRKNALSKGFAVVQRPTGGGIVYHENDLCFSMIWRKEHRSLPWEIIPSYCSIHQWLKKTLEIHGIETEVCNAKVESGDQALCFRSPVPYDLMSNGKKIVGGAQWRDGRVALHQGSLQIPPEKANLFVFRNTFRSIFKVEFE